MDTALKRVPFKGLWAVAACVGLAAALLRFTTPYMAVASLAYLLLACGVVQSARRKAHVALMSSGVVMDLGVVLTLEVKRSAVATALGGELGPLQMGHVAFSLAAVILYVPTMVLGWRGIRGGKGGPSRLKAHRILGKVAFLFRTVGFGLMFSLLGRA